MQIYDLGALLSKNDRKEMMRPRVLVVRTSILGKRISIGTLRRTLIRRSPRIGAMTNRISGDSGVSDDGEDSDNAG
jgi:hypothetical protein